MFKSGYKFQVGDLIVCSEYYDDMIIKSSTIGMIINRFIIFGEENFKWESKFYEVLTHGDNVNRYEEWQLDFLQVH